MKVAYNNNLSIQNNINLNKHLLTDTNEYLLQKQSNFDFISHKNNNAVKKKSYLKKYFFEDGYSIKYDLNEMYNKYKCYIIDNDVRAFWNIDNLKTNYLNLNFEEYYDHLKTEKINIISNNKILNDSNFIKHNIKYLLDSEVFIFLFKIIEQDLIDVLENAIEYKYEENKYLQNILSHLKLIKGYLLIVMSNTIWPHDVGLGQLQDTNIAAAIKRLKTVLWKMSNRARKSFSNLQIKVLLLDLLNSKEEDRIKCNSKKKQQKAFIDLADETNKIIQHNQSFKLYRKFFYGQFEGLKSMPIRGSDFRPITCIEPVWNNTSKENNNFHVSTSIDIKNDTGKKIKRRIDKYSKVGGQIKNKCEEDFNKICKNYIECNTEDSSTITKHAILVINYHILHTMKLNGQGMKTCYYTYITNLISRNTLRHNNFQISQIVSCLKNASARNHEMQDLKQHFSSCRIETYSVVQEGQCTYCRSYMNTVNNLTTKCDIFRCINFLLYNKYDFKKTKKVMSHFQDMNGTRILIDIKINYNKPDIFLEKLRKYDLLADELDIIYNSKTKFVYYVMTCINELRIMPFLETYNHSLMTSPEEEVS
ncbi:hypothetical protein NAPIS_ORF01584 [Vairimorpha apis BRL 01]|uniref:Uncharacterized protein n=1 Tax=Vairimorpha apis BRL 01 TaxID=1037528 RepID=T0L8G9_9MICR|nr:hypothetical protein NAPIS_ORF01584 [Vairimorpha apis BRL 01]